MRLILLPFFILILSIGKGQELGARNYALGGNFITQSDIISATSNLAKMAELSSFSTGISSKNSFLLPEFQESLFCAGLPILKGFFSFKYTHFGYRLYRQNQLSVNYALAISPSFSIGVALITNVISSSEINTKTTSFYPNVGFNYKLNENLELGILLSNVSLSKITKNSTALWPVKADIGLSYSVNSKVSLLCNYLLSLHEQNAIAVGIEYIINSTISLQTGVANKPMIFSIGMGMTFNKLSIDIASSYQAFLGISPSISIRFESLN